jgi:two-component system, chemotaxis family, sensor kinase CheA
VSGFRVYSTCDVVEADASERVIVDDLDDVVAEFLVETIENLDQFDRGIVELEANPDSPELLASIFRSIHTVEGTSGLFGFIHLESVSYAGETLLSVLRDGALVFTPTHAATLLTMCDALRAMSDSISSSGGDGDDEYAELSPG